MGLLDLLFDLKIYRFVIVFRYDLIFVLDSKLVMVKLI